MASLRLCEEFREVPEPAASGYVCARRLQTVPRSVVVLVPPSLPQRLIFCLVSTSSLDAASSLTFLEAILKVFDAKITVPKVKPVAADAKDAKDSKDSKAADSKSKTTDAATKTGAAAAATTTTGEAKKEDSKQSAAAPAPKAKAASKEKEISDKAQAIAQSAPYIQAATLVRTEMVRRKCELTQLDAAKVCAVPCCAVVLCWVCSRPHSHAFGGWFGPRSNHRSCWMTASSRSTISWVLWRE
jgi:hypothetical protein